jgi:hypothetical protein
MRMFWEPHMRAHLFTLVDAGSGAIGPVVVDAVNRLR